MEPEGSQGLIPGHGSTLKHGGLPNHGFIHVGQPQQLLPQFLRGSLWVVYDIKSNSLAIFHDEIDALRLAVKAKLEVIEVQPGEQTALS